MGNTPFTAYNPQDPLALASLHTKVQPAQESPDTHITIKTVDIAIVHEDNSIFEEPHTIAYPKNQDVLDLICYFEDNNELFIVVNKSNRPVVATRPQLISDITGIHEAPHAEYTDGMLYELPGKILRPEEGEISLQQAIDTLLHEKIGCEKIAEHFLTGAYYPSIGSSTECCQARAILVKKPESMEAKVTYGDNFLAERVIMYMTPQQIIDGFFAGTIRDMRLVLLTFELARQKNVSLTIPTLFPEQNIFSEYDADAVELVSADALRDKLTQAMAHHHIRDMRVTLSSAHDAFLSLYNVDATNVRNNKVSDSYTAQMIVRNGVDTVDAGAYFWHKGQLCMVTKASIRPAIKARNFQSHPIHTESTLYNLESIAGSLTPDMKTREQLIARTAEYIARKVGYEADEKNIAVAGSFYPSPGHNPEKTYLLFAQIDPTKKAVADAFVGETPIVFLMDIDEILKAGEEGMIRDPRVLIQAHILKQYFNYQSPENTPTLPEKMKLQSLINAPSHTKQFLQEHAPDIDRALSEIPEYRKLIYYIEQERGAVVGEGLENDTEKHFFAAMLPIMSKPKDDRKAPFYLLHDFRHYADGDMTPYMKGADGSWSMMTESEYIEAMSWAECHAVHYSDYIIPIKYGVEKAEAIFGGKSVARSLIELGITDEQKALETIVSIERDGIIPEEILRHPRYEEEKDVIVGRLLRFHVMDKEQSKGQYSNWAKMPYAAEVALRFCTTYNSLSQFKDVLTHSMETILNYPEGVNKIKSMLMRTVNFRIRTLALKFGVLLDTAKRHEIAERKNLQTSVGGYLDILEKISKDLVAYNATVTSMDINQANIRIMRKHDYYDEYISYIEKKYYKAVGSISTLTAEEKDRLINRLLPYFPGFVDIDPAFLEEEVAKLETENKKKIS